MWVEGSDFYQAFQPLSDLFLAIKIRAGPVHQPITLLRELAVSQATR